MSKSIIACTTLILAFNLVNPSFAELPPDIQKNPSAPEKIKGIYISGWTAGSNKKFSRLLELIDETELNAVVIDIKDAEGLVTYRSKVPWTKSKGTRSYAVKDISLLLGRLKARNIYPIARVVCFRDPLLSQAYPDIALKSKEGELWKDRAGVSWLNPYNKEGWKHLLDLSKEAASLGFKEIQYDYVRFPTDGDIKNIDYGERATISGRSKAISDFLAYAKTELKPLGVAVSADLFGIVATDVRGGRYIGQDMVKMAREVDYVSPMIYPSHYANIRQNGTGQLINDVLFKYPDLEPYSVVYNSLAVAQKRLKSSKASGRLRPWLQAFTASYLGEDRYQPYHGKQIKEQIKAVSDAGIDEWMLWNANNRYPNDGLLRDQGDEELLRPEELTKYLIE
ncbi:MAG: putative glycoside hydrolase [bacterium]|nr:putative glycoside hydrolase [bacterium]